MAKRPDLDWPVIEARIKAKEPLARIAKSIGISRQALWERCQRQGLTVKGNPGRQVMKVKDAIKALPYNGAGIELGQFTKDNAAYIIEKISQGNTFRTAAGCVGITEPQLQNWFIRDEAFAAVCRAERAKFLSTREGNIARAGDRGQWQADAHILSRDPESRGNWGEPAANRGAVAIQVVLNVDRDDYRVTTITPDETDS